MKSTITLPNTEAFVPKLPWAFSENAYPTNIVLFYSERTGTLVSTEDGTDVGYSSDSWTPYFNTKIWTPLPKGSKITLELE